MMKSKMMKMIAMGLMVLSASVLLAGCGGEQKKAADTAKDSAPNGVLKVATNCTFPPFQSIDEKTGKFDGVYHVLHGAISPMLGIRTGRH